MKILDLPPIWLLLALSLVWGIGWLVPLPLFGAAGKLVGIILVLVGLGLMVSAVAQMRLAGTTFIPRRDPQALVTGGVFSFSRNPIYLGDVLVLTGVVLWWDVPLSLPLILAFISIIQARFILDEEARLKIGFGERFEQWSRKTSRWIGWNNSGL